jgi:glycosyltransferase involved in cell wall biosynthesis
VLQRYGVEEDGYVLFVGRLVAEKGVHHLIRAFNQSGIQSELQLIIVGGDPYGRAYELSLRKMAKKNVKFLGYVYGADMENLFKGAYLYATASELEGTSPALLSAMGFGNCVLVSDIPENLETIGDAGVTFKNRDCEDLRDKMLNLISNSDVVREYRKRAVERIARFYSWDSVAERMERLYLSLTERN